MSDGYSIQQYAAMHADRERVEAYVAAVEDAVGPETFLLEIGTGTGLIACAAARAGARRVVAVEPSPVIEIARRIARDNGVADRIEFIRGLSEDFECDQPADVIVSDLRGALPLHGSHFRTIADARDRLLGDGGTLIAARDRTFAAPVSVADAWARRIGFCDDGPMDAGVLRDVLVNLPFHHDVGEEHLLADGLELSTIDYEQVTPQSLLDATVTFDIRSGGSVHGFVVWFVTEVDDTRRISTGPGNPLMAYGRLVFPVGRPFDVEPGEPVELRFRRHPVADSYVTAWSGGVPGDAERRFDQSSLGGLLDDRRSVVREDARPTAAPRARALSTLLAAMDGTHSFEDLVSMTRDQYGGLFRRPEQLRAWVSEMVADHAER